MKNHHQILNTSQTINFSHVDVQFAEMNYYAKLGNINVNVINESLLKNAILMVAHDNTRLFTTNKHDN